MPWALLYNTRLTWRPIAAYDRGGTAKLPEFRPWLFTIMSRAAPSSAKPPRRAAKLPGTGPEPHGPRLGAAACAEARLEAGRHRLAVSCAAAATHG